MLNYKIEINFTDKVSNYKKSFSFFQGLIYLKNEAWGINIKLNETFWGDIKSMKGKMNFLVSRGPELEKNSKHGIFVGKEKIAEIKVISKKKKVKYKKEL
jgi:hypothetical protein